MSSALITKSVRFDQVFIHEFPLIMGDNPAVSKGAPLTIDWKPMAHDVVDLDIYEYLREPERRHRKRMILSTSKRAKILMNAGYSIDDIAEMTLQVEDAKRVRAEHALESANLLTNTVWNNFRLKNGNIMELLSGAAEGTGRTLFLAPTNAVLKGANATGQALGKVGSEVVKGTGKVVVGTGKVATDVVVGTGKLGYNVVATTGKVTTDIAVGTVKGTANVVVGAGKATTAVVVGTGKLGYDVVKNTGKRMSKFMTLNNFNESFSKELTLDISELGYEDADESARQQQEDQLLQPQQQQVDSPPPPSTRMSSSSRRSSSRRRSNDTGGGSEIAKGNPAPLRMSRRTSSNGSVAVQVGRRSSANSALQNFTAMNSGSGSGSSGKSKRRGSGSNGALAGSFSNFTNMFTGRGIRRANSSTGEDKFGLGSTASGSGNTGTTSRRTKSSDGSGIPGSKRDRRRRATMTPGGSAPISPRSKSANAATTLHGPGGVNVFSELAQMEQFLNYVRDSPASTVNPIIGNAYTNRNANNSDSSIDEDYDHSDEDMYDGTTSPPGSPDKGNRPRTVGRSQSAPENPINPAEVTAEPVTPAA